MAKKILIAAANYWDSPYQVGSHHYARIFAKNGWDVFFVSDPISPLHFLAAEKRQVQERYGIYRGRTGSGNDRIKTYVPMALFTPNEKPFFRSKVVTESWYKATFPNLVGLVKAKGFGEVDLMWFDSIIQYFWLKEIRYKASVLRVSDIMDAFKKNSKNVKNLENRLKSEVDHIIYTADTLKPYLAGFESKSVYVPNGVDITHFLDTDKKMPEDLKNIPKPIAIYVGAIDEWFALDFLIEVAKKNKDISFVIIGDPKINISGAKETGNIYFLGRRPYSHVPAYIYNSDVGIIIFDVRHPVVKSINPIKLYEYMACGLPVVATKWDELESINSPAYLAEGPEDFSNKLHIALDKKDRSVFSEFANNNSWDSRYAIIEKEILL